jgi:hypothetical protein
MLRLEQRQVKRPGQQTRNFAVPILDPDVGQVPALTQGDRPGLTPVSSAVVDVPSVAEQMAAVDVTEERPPRANASVELPPTGAPLPGGAWEDDEPVADVVAAFDNATEGGVTAPPESGELINAHQQRHLFALFGELGVKARDDRLRWACEVTGRTVDSSKDLTEVEADRLIGELVHAVERKRAEQLAPRS